MRCVCGGQDERVLVLHYEEMKEDIGGAAARIARHLGLELTEAEMGGAVDRMSFEWMKANAGAFNPRCVYGDAA